MASNPAEIFNLFINRERELGWLSQLIGVQPGFKGIRVLSGGPDTGLTTAVKKSANFCRGESRLVYLNMQDSHPDSIMLQTVNAVVGMGPESAKRILLPLVQPNKQDAFSRLLSGGAQGVPFVGAALAELFGLLFDYFSPRETSDRYSSDLNRIMEALAESGPVVVIADHFQNAQEHHIAQISNLLYAAKELNLIVAQNAPNRALAKPSTDSRLNLFLKTVELFPCPDVDLGTKIIDHIAGTFNASIDRALASSIEGGIHYFLNKVYEALVGSREPRHELGQTHIDILCLLATAQFPLSFDILLECLVKSQRHSSDGSTVDTAISQLEARGLIAIQDAVGFKPRVTVTSHGSRAAARNMQRLADKLYYANMLYRTLSELIDLERVASKFYAFLMFRLASIVDPPLRDRWSIETVKACVSTSNFFEAGRVLSFIESNLPDDTEETTLTVIAACIATKKYDRALQHLEKVHRLGRQYEVLDCILRYRALYFDAARDKMAALLEVLPDGNNKCILATYYVALSIEFDRANALEHRLPVWLDKLEPCDDFGYLLNVAAALHEPRMSRRLCESSLSYFNAQQDRFGIGGATANIGVHALKLGDFELALQKSLEGHKMLAQFGIQHVHLAANNIGCCYLMLRNLVQAERWLRRSLELGQTTTVRVNAFTNMAALHAMKGNAEPSIDYMESAVREAESKPLIAVRRKLAWNLSLIGGLLEGIDADTLAGYLQRLDGPQIALDHTLETPVSKRDKDLSKFFAAHYHVPTSQYWFPNPMDLFKGKRLSVEANF